MKHLLIASLICLLTVACGEQNTQPNQPTARPEPTMPTNPPKRGLTMGLLNEEEVDVYGGVALTDNTKKGTIAYINERNKQGAIIINGEKMSLYKAVVKNGSYLLIGDDVQIASTPAVYDEEAEGDCFYGDIKEITITYKGMKMNIGDISVQDCQNAGI